MYTTAIRTHEISVAHRLMNHQGACQRLHGHNYILEIEVTSDTHTRLDDLGMVIDFGEIKRLFCAWLDENWDHRLILCVDDPLVQHGRDFFEEHAPGSLCVVSFNPTAEKFAEYLLYQIFPQIISQTGYDIRIDSVVIHETSKCKVQVVSLQC